MTMLTTWVPEDAVLGDVAPLALAVAAGTCLVIHPGPRWSDRSSTLADLVANGPRASDLTPQRSGVAVIGRGDVTNEDATEVVDALVAGWPAVVMGSTSTHRPVGTGVVPILLEGVAAPASVAAPHVLQRTRRRPLSGDPTFALPVAPRSAVERLRMGARPAPGRWLRAWTPIWEARWP